MTDTLYDIAKRVGPPNWVIEMHEHYNKYGFFRAGDVRRVLGDPCKGVSMPRNEEDARDYFFKG